MKGADGLTGRYQEIYYQIWRAQKSTDQNAKQKLRNNARLELSELRSRRPDWSLIPLALAEIGLQELADLQQEKQNLAASGAKTQDARSRLWQTSKSVRKARRTKQPLFIFRPSTWGRETCPSLAVPRISFTVQGAMPR